MSKCRLSVDSCVEGRSPAAKGDVDGIVSTLFVLGRLLSRALPFSRCHGPVKSAVFGPIPLNPQSTCEIHFFPVKSIMRPSSTALVGHRPACIPASDKVRLSRVRAALFVFVSMKTP